MGQGKVDKEVLDLTILGYSVIVIAVISITIILFFIAFQKRKNKLLIDKAEQQQKFDEELIVTQQEIQEETLSHIGRELHDNVGQLLSVATMQLNAVAKVAKDDIKSKVNNASDALKESLNEVRALSKSLNSDVIYNIGFDATVKNEIERLNKTGLLTALLIKTGKKVDFENKKDEIILFRILQEFFSNTLKYAKAENLKVTLDYQKDYLHITVNDDGKGFDVINAKRGSGLTNMQKRSELLKSEFNLTSELNKGTTLSIKYPYRIV